MRIALTIAATTLMLPLLILAAFALGPAALVILFLAACALLVVGFEHATLRHLH